MVSLSNHATFARFAFDVVFRWHRFVANRTLDDLPGC
jgi:hypothetical protein